MNSQNEYGERALHRAAQYGSFEIILVKAGFGFEFA